MAHFGLLMIAAFLVAGATAWIGTLLVRRYAAARTIMDVPNARSMHTHPVPRGGGIGIVATTLIGSIILSLAGLVPWAFTAALTGGGSLVAWIGWLDDRRGVGVRVRLVVQFAAAVLATTLVRGLAPDPLDSWMILGYAVSVVAVVWAINLYNFMDGIDGLAGAQAVSAAGIAGLLVAARTGDAGMSLAMLVLAGAAAGFLAHNWAPARIFMGDVGSGFLGYAFAVAVLFSSGAGALSVVAWALLFGVFLTDSGLTLLRRLLRAERVYEAHRKHAYQRLVLGGFSHAAVSTLVLAINVALGVAAWYHLSTGSWLPVAAAAAILGAWYVWAERVMPMARETRRPGLDG